MSCYDIEEGLVAESNPMLDPYVTHVTHATHASHATHLDHGHSADVKVMPLTFVMYLLQPILILCLFILAWNIDPPLIFH